MLRAPRTRILLPIVLLAAAGCADAAGGPEAPELPALELVSAGPLPVLPGTRLSLAGAGFVSEELASYSVRFEGTVGARAVDAVGAAEPRDEAHLLVPIRGDLAGALIGGGDGTFVGAITVTRTGRVGGAEDRASLQVELPVATRLLPGLDSVGPDAWYPGDRVTVAGGPFLMAGEGRSWLRLDGELTGERAGGGTGSEPIVDRRLGIAPDPDTGERGTAYALVSPSLLGPGPATFSGTVVVLNEMQDGAVESSQAVAIDALPLRLPRVDSLTPDAVARGQRFEVRGRGLMPSDPLAGEGSWLLLEGEFEPDRGPVRVLAGDEALVIAPDGQVDNVLVEAALRIGVAEDGSVTGLGLDPGHFSGTITPILGFGGQEVAGESLELELDVLPSYQAVHLQALPELDEALERFGLRAAADAVLARILAAVTRDYAGINIGFAYEPPADFLDYSIVELAGSDPNGAGLLGLDNTVGKDVGNLRLDDVIGGFNPETRARHLAAYGGVFVAELMAFSPTLNAKEWASPRFDDIFGPFAPELGGRPVTAAEAGGVFDDPVRGEQVAEAVRVLGNLVGNTVAHEVGHTLGLVPIEGIYHNVGDNDGWIMDVGVYRPFEERAEIDGFGPAVFGPRNREYLESILPVTP